MNIQCRARRALEWRVRFGEGELKRFRRNPFTVLVFTFGTTFRLLRTAA